MSLTPALRELLRDRQVAGLRHRLGRMRAGVLQHQDVLGAHVERRIVDARGKIGERGEHHRHALVLEQLLVRRRALEDRALGREIAEQRHQAALRFKRLVARRDDGAVDIAVVALGGEPLAERAAGDGQAIEMQQRLELAQQRAHAAGGEEVLHVAVADRLEVDQHRRGVGQAVELVERDLHAGASGDRGQMDDRVGRAAERKQHAQRVLDRLRVDDLVGRHRRADQVDRRHAGRLGGAQAVGMHRRDRGGAGQDQPERFGDAGHGRGGAHHRAGARGHREVALDLRNLLGADFAGAIARPEAAAVGAGAEPLALVPPGHHRTGDQHDRRPPGRDRAHELRRHGLVAAAHQHHGVHRLRADHLLGVDGHQISVFQAGRIEEHLAERHGREIDRQAARRQHAALHRVQQLREMPVAVVEAGAGVGDADHRALQHFARITHRTREGTAQIQRKIPIAVVGEAVFEPGSAVSHPILPQACPRRACLTCPSLGRDP